jgi:hypothetical protein
MQKWFWKHKFQITRFFKTFGNLVFMLLIVTMAMVTIHRIQMHRISEGRIEDVKSKLMLSMLYSREMIEKNHTGLDVIYDYLMLNQELVFAALDDNAQRRQLAQNVKKLIKENPDAEKLILILKGVNQIGRTQYIYIYLPVFPESDNSPKLIFVLDADMMYGDEIFSGYEFVTDNMDGFVDVIHSKTVQYIRNNDEFGSHLSIVAPVNEDVYSNVFIGVDHDMNDYFNTMMLEGFWLNLIGVLLIIFGLWNAFWKKD